MTAPVIVQAVRTPIGRRGGRLATVHPVSLLAGCLTEVVKRAGIDPAEVGQVVGGCAAQVGEQAANVTRNAWLHAGLSQGTAASTIDCQCGSSQQAFNVMAALVASGAEDIGIACGVESMTRIPIGTSISTGGSPWPSDWTVELADQFTSAERIAAFRGITREQVDALGVRSQRLAQRAWDEGRYAAEVVPIEVELLDGESTPTGERATVDRDEGLRDTTAESVARLRTVLPDGVHSAATCSQISDGAAALMVMSEEKAGALGLQPLARVVGQCAVGTDVHTQLDGPVDATARLLERTGRSVGDIDLFEVNEAFAAVVLSWAQVHGADPDRVNVNGGAMALGHPLGASGARLLTTAVHEMRRSGASSALVTMCVGGALGTATLLENV